MIWKAKKFLFIKNIGNHLSVQPAIQFEWIDLSFLQLPTRTLSAERNPLQIFYNIFCKKKKLFLGFVLLRGGTDWLK